MIRWVTTVRWAKSFMTFCLLLTMCFASTLAFARGGGHSHNGSSGGIVHVNGYTRHDGTYVHGYDRASPGSGGSVSSDSGSHVESSPKTPASRTYILEDEKSGIHATNSRDEVPHHVLEKIEGAPKESKATTRPAEIKAGAILTPPAKVPKVGKADNYYDSSGVLRDGKTGRIHRSALAKQNFRKLNPCPSTGKTGGACPGYVIDHIKPLKRGGKDLPSNMQWQTVQDAKVKDKWE